MATSKFEETYADQVKQLIAFATEMCQSKVVEPGFLFSLFEEMFELSSPQNTHLHLQMFREFLDEFGGLTSGAGFPGCPVEERALSQLQLKTTKMCKTLMKKLSLQGDSEAIFEMQQLLARRLPLSHMSGLNVSGRFSDTHLTI